MFAIQLFIVVVANKYQQVCFVCVLLLLGEKHAKNKQMDRRTRASACTQNTEYNTRGPAMSHAWQPECATKTAPEPPTFAIRR